MDDEIDQRLHDLARAPPRRRRVLARRLLERVSSWDAWRDALGRLHATEPAVERVVAAALTEAAAATDAPLFAARFRLMAARALHRTGSPAVAADELHEAARALDEQDDDALATKALVLRVDALAHAGSTAAALEAADDVQARIRGPDAPTWRAVLEINRANALRLAGRLDAAARAFDRAARRLERRGDAHTAAIARMNAGVAMLDAGDAVRSRERFASAAAALEAAGVTDMARDARHNEAWAALRCGDLGPALATLEALADEHAAAGHDRREAVCRMDLAEALHRGGDHAEAERVALAAATAFDRASARAERAEALLLAAHAAVRAGRPAARDHLSRARASAEQAERPGLAARCALLELEARARAGEALDGRALATLARQARRRGQHALGVEADLLRVRALRARGRTRDARRLLSQPVVARAGRPWLRAAVETARSVLDADQGRPGDAIRRLRRVARFLDTVRRDLPGAWLRTTFVVDRLDPYLQLVDLLLERGRAADRREAEAILDALAARRFLERAPQAAPPASAALRRRLEALYDRLARGDGPTRGLAASEAERIEREARQIEQRLARARRDAERRGHAPAHVAVVGAGASRLPARTALVHLWPHRGRLLALVRAGNRVGERVDLGDLDAIRGALDRIAFHADRIRCFGVGGGGQPLHGALDALAQQVLAPLCPADFPDRVRLVVDPDAPPIPWSLLPVDGQPLGVARQVAWTPSARVRPRRRRPTDAEVVIALGEPDLPHVEREMASLGPAAERLEHGKATRASLRQALERARVVHLAGHGFAAPDAPYMGGVRLADGWFSSIDVPARIASELVVLAACRAGHATGRLGAAWGGLPTALLAAGARWVVWTTDDVDDSTTADLMARFHEARRSAPPDAAFGAALHAVWQANGHPAHLLPFRISGVPA